MQRPWRFVIIALLVIATTATAIAQSRVTVSLGHAGKVTDTAGRDDLDLAFSVGSDGKLIVWDLEHDGLRHSWQISHQPLTRMALHPQEPFAVVFVEEGLRHGRLVGLNWETGNELFSTRVDARPNYLAYSPQGTFIVYTVTSFDSIRFLSARDGSPRTFLEEGFGVVGFVQMARSERNVMTYIPSRGEFIYWQLQSGDELQSVSTRARLEYLTLIDERTQRFLAGADSEQLLVVDNLTGETKATYPVRPVYDIAYDAEEERILVLTEQRGERTALAFRYTSGRLRRDFYRTQNLSDTTISLSAVGSDQRGFLAGSESGEIAFFDADNGRRTVLGPADLTPVIDVAVTPGRVHLSLGDRIVSVVSDLFESDPGDPLRAGFLRDTRIAPSSFKDISLHADGQRLLLWGSEEAGTLWELLPPEGTPRLLYDSESDVPIARVSPSSAGVLIVYRDGRIVQIDQQTGIERFRYRTVGAQDAIWDPQLGLIVAKTRTSSFSSSVVVVDQLTQETFAAETGTFLATRLALDPQTDTLFTLGLAGRQSAATTTVERLTGDGLGDRRVLVESPRELSRGDLLWDPETRSLVSSMEYNVVRRWRGRRAEEFDRTERLHTELTAGSQFVIARNMDGTVTFWDRRSGEHLVDLHVVGDEWIAIGLEGRYIASSPRAERYLTFLPAADTRLEMQDFRLSTPFTYPPEAD